MRFLRSGKLPDGDTPEVEATDTPGVEAADPTDWRRLALDGVGIPWVRIDRDLRVVEASAAALEYFDSPTLPSSLIAFTRTPELESRAREVLEGGSGPWEVEAANFRRVFRLRGIDLGDDGALLHLEDITDVRRLEAVRADFVANLAHELRTPVASLSLAAETLSGELSADAAATFVARIAEETRYIEGLLRTVTELALLEGEVRLQVSEFNLREVVIDSWRRVIDHQGPAELVDEVSPGLWLSADRVRVAEVLQNLFENAHRFSPPGKAVTVGAEAGPGGTTIWVVDQGPGIPPTELPRVFERFYKVDRARTRRGDGSGLGLALSKHLVSAHGGRIWAEATDAGGTRVLFTIPAHGAPVLGTSPASL